MRAPNPTILRYRPHINIVALCLAALGFMTLWDTRLRFFGSATMFLTFMAWAYLTSRVKPKIDDYLEYLKLAAEEYGYVDWLDEVEFEFKHLWGIETLEALTDG